MRFPFSPDISFSSTGLFNRFHTEFIGTHAYLNNELYDIAYKGPSSIVPCRERFLQFIEL